MASWLEKLFREHGVFKFPRSTRNLPVCRIRPLRGEDVEACILIYQLNEGGNFSGGLDSFRRTLEEGHSLYLVCEENGEIRAMGGMNIRYCGNDEMVELFFGMVHPDHHHRGFGTAIVLARLCILPAPRDEWQVRMHSVADGFHRKFGFHPYEVVSDENGNRIVRLQLYLSLKGIARCRVVLASAHILVDCAGCGIPAAIVAAPPEGNPLGTAAIPPPPSWANKQVNLAQAAFITIVVFCTFVVIVGICVWYFKFRR
ncbi:MAG: GNAT family N-acetyltransferase [Verrucomicrobiaceae bacterium]|nr:MAG: GNAT family N-acetyltransferase [Verrucomicrobiaceae bacterium]